MKPSPSQTHGHRLALAAAIALLATPAPAWDMLVWANRDSNMNLASSWNDANGEVSGAMSLADGAKVVVDLGPGGVHGCANFTGSGVAYSAAGEVVVEMVPLEGLDRGTRVKILDWSGATPTDASAFDLSRYTLSYDETFFSSAKLLVEGDAMYLAFGVINHFPSVMVLR